MSLDQIFKDYQNGNLNFALKQLEAIIASNPSKEAYELMGKILLEMGNDDEALYYFDKAGDIISKAKILISKGNYREALEELKNDNSAESKILRGIIYTRLEDYSRALEEIKDLEEKTQNVNPIYFKIKGIAEYYSGNYYEAIRSLTKAIQSYPLDAELFYYRALAKLALEKDKEAEKDIDIAIQLNPYYAEAYFNKGLIREKKGKIEEAISYYSKSIDINPEFVNAYVRRAKAYMKSGMESNAIEDIKVVKRLKSKEENNS
ncbi:tetratricopeptide repeat protein [Acidianus sulfidivorans JP7]|uniref:Tetratricopeptide repeat protein n=1 Tax=Acidianus sulfidivorans JP7 TaxID=619593 RepID=A0A2U9IK00_9CREN|nr:tetratricopeptide repeat protein [Acidianus sulfidivorans]AWR96369.1 tetratricopeptide repeat protein [Acidianus sulfidivorans JP7]